MNKLTYTNFIQLTAEQRFNKFISSLAITNRTPEFYVDWEKVVRNTQDFELELNTLNYLIGKQDIYAKALNLFTKQPDLIKALPILIATRVKNLDILISANIDKLNYTYLDFEVIDTKKIKDYLDFAENTGLLNFLQNKLTSNLVDYVYGVEVGLDTNARKNRSGKAMESLLSTSLESLAKKVDIEYKLQISAKSIFEQWNIEVPTDKAARSFDAAILLKKPRKLFLIETNFYGGGGSKLKSVAGEFITLNNLIKTAKTPLDFIWITDGEGWQTAKAPLQEAFAAINNIFNLAMVKNNFLEELLKANN